MLPPDPALAWSALAMVHHKSYRMSNNVRHEPLNAHVCGYGPLSDEEVVNVTPVGASAKKKIIHSSVLALPVKSSLSQRVAGVCQQ